MAEPQERPDFDVRLPWPGGQEEGDAADSGRDVAPPQAGAPSRENVAWRADAPPGRIEALEAAVAELRRRFERLATLEQALEVRRAQLVGMAEKRMRAVEQAATAGEARLQQSAADRGAELGERAAAHQSALERATQASLSDLRRAIEEATTGLDRAAARRRDDLERVVADRSRALEEIAGARQGQLDQAVAARLDEIQRAVQAGEGELERLVTRSEKELDQSVAARTAELERVASRRQNEIGQVADSRRTELGSHVPPWAQDLEARSARMVHESKRMTRLLVAAVATGGVALVVAVVALVTGG